MISLSPILSAYEWKARAFPVFLVLLPGIIHIAYYTNLIASLPVTVFGLALVLAITFLLSDLARRAGKSAETKLLDEWDGYPSKRFLRHRDNNLNPNTKARFHQNAELLIENLSMPSAEDELRDPQRADAIYESVAQKLRTLSHKSKNDNLILVENIVYGFRRNLYGLKYFALTNAMICLIYTCNDAYNYYKYSGYFSLSDFNPFFWLFPYIGVIVFSVTKKSVRSAADDYARQLLGLLDSLERKS